MLLPSRPTVYVWRTLQQHRSVHYDTTSGNYNHGGYYQFSDGLRVEPTTVTLRGGVKLQASSLLPAPLPKALQSPELLTCHSWLKEERDAEQGPCTTTTMIIARGRMKRRRQEDKETTTTGVDTTIVCPRVCDNHHYSPEEEERLTTMVTSIGELAQGEGRHYDTMTGSTAMVTTMQDRLQERSSEKRPTTSSDYIIRLTDRLLRLGAKISSCFSHFFSLFRPFPEGTKSTWEIQKTVEKGLFPQISSDLLKPPSLKPPFAAPQTEPH